MSPTDGDHNKNIGNGNANDNRKAAGVDERLNRNPFIRFKNHIDSNIYRGFETWSSYLWTIPSSSDDSRDASRDTYTPCNTSRVVSHNASQDASLNASQNGWPSTSTATASTPNLDRPQPSDSSAPGAPGAAGAPGHAGDLEDAVNIDDVFRWAAYSPYSPLNLQHLRQPVPRDTTTENQQFPFASRDASPSSSTDSPFTFRHAFEDLLILNHRGELPSLSSIRLGNGFQNVFSKSLDERGMPVSFWVLTTGQAGLFHAYFPRLDAPWGLSSLLGPKGMFSTPWFAGLQRWHSILQNDHSASFCFKPTTDRTSSIDWVNVWNGAWGGSTSREWSGRLFGDQGEKPSQVWTWPSNRNGAAGDTNGDGAAERAPSMLKMQAEVEEDLYRFLAPSEVPPNKQQQQQRQRQQQQHAPSTTTTSKTTHPDDDNPQAEMTETTEIINPHTGGKIIRTVRRREDKANGRTETNTTVKRYNADGTLASQSTTTRSSRTWSSSSSPSSSPGPAANGRSEEPWGSSWSASARFESSSSQSSSSSETQGDGDGDNRPKKKNGWFWEK